jgi:hypothetical protein
MAGEGHPIDERPGTPPRWAETVLERVLAGADGQTVTGDLREEYAEAILPRLGRLGADLWYLRQVCSLAPRGVSRQSGMRVVLSFVSVLTFGCGCWLAVMEWLLRHPGHLVRSAEDASIALVSLATIVVLLLNLGVRTERWLWAGALALVGVAVRGLVRDLRSPHFEGFVLLVSLALAAQSVFMLLSLGRTGPRPLASDAGEPHWRRP